MKLYIPFNMIVDTDFGIIKFTEKYFNISEYSKNKLKSFLIHRTGENPIPEYCDLRKLDKEKAGSLYETMIERYYSAVLKLSNMTDILSFVINTYKLGFSNDLEITIGCNTEEEMNFLKKSLSSLKFTITMVLNKDINLNDFEYIFTKYLDSYYIDYLINNKIKAKRLYVANYGFNTIVDEESGTTIIDPVLHMRLESEGFVVNTISVYNKKQ